MSEKEFKQPHSGTLGDGTQAVHTFATLNGADENGVYRDVSITFGYETVAA